MSGFGAELERWMRVRGVGVRELHRRSGYSAGYITQLRQGLRNPSPEAARDLDDALGAAGALAASAPPTDDAFSWSASLPLPAWRDFPLGLHARA